MNFKFGVYGFEKSELENAYRPFLIEVVKFSDNFVEFSTKKFWNGLSVVNGIANNLGVMYPQKFRPGITKIWVEGEPFEVFLLDKLRIAEEGITEATRLLRNGKNKSRGVDRDRSAQQARLKLMGTSKALGLQ